MSTNDKIESVASGADQTNPYTPHLNEINALKDILAGITWTDDTGGVDADIQIAIDAFDVEVVLFNSAVGLVPDDGGYATTINDYYNSWWNGDNINYKNTPKIYFAADDIKNEVRAAEEPPLAPVAFEDTFHYSGTLSWSDATLAGYSALITPIAASLSTIVGGVVLDGDAGLVDIETTKVTTAIADLGVLTGDFSTDYISVEATAYSEALTYLNAYAYIVGLEGNPDNAPVQDVATKFSGNLP